MLYKEVPFCCMNSDTGGLGVSITHPPNHPSVYIYMSLSPPLLFPYILNERYETQTQTK